MDLTALKAAIEVSLMPSRVRALRDGPLPDGVPVVLRIAAGDEDAERQAMAALDRPAHVVRDASTFYIEQMLLHPDADSYRVLGASRHASSAELRQNMALLIRWLHPDKNPLEERAIFVNRVNRAWDDLKTPERRSAYDLELARRPSPQTTRDSRGARSKRVAGEPVRRSSSGRQPQGRSRPVPRRLDVNDLLGPPKNGRVGIFRRLMGFLLRPKA